MRSRRLQAVLALVAVVLASAWASGWHRFTWGARVGTFACALGALGVGLYWRYRLRPTPPPGAAGPPVTRRGAWLWLAVIVVAALWDVLGLLTPPDRHHLTLSAMELAYRPLHALLFACWLVIGWLLVSTPVPWRRR